MKRSAKVQLCDEADCDRQRYGRGMCKTHYMRWFRENRGRIERRGRPMCSVDGCERPHEAHGFCVLHYRRLQANGTVELSTVAEADRFWAKVNKTDTCWLWAAGLADTGYGTFKPNGLPSCSAHRYSYRLNVGPIPPGLDLDHLCRVRRCVNPAHLEPVTHAENVRRAMLIGHPTGPKTCKRGHDWSVTPPYVTNRSCGKVSRRCRLCQADLDRARKA